MFVIYFPVKSEVTLMDIPHSKTQRLHYAEHACLPFV